jgi:hypothetical protein
LGVFLLCTIPVVIWNAQHGWITVYHVAGDAGLQSEWHPTLGYLLEFCASELLLLNPFFLIGALTAAVLIWKKHPRNPLHVYLLCLGTPVFLGYGLYSLHSRVLGNWIAVSVLPMFCLMVAYAHEYRPRIRPFVTGGVVFGVLAAALLHDSDLAGKINGALPGEMDPTHRLRGWAETAQLAESEREKLAANGEPAFIIGGHYGITGELSFYSPPAAQAAGTPLPLVYCAKTDEPVNQFYFWDDYNYLAHRRGQNAIYVELIGSNPYAPGWFWHWLKHEPLESVPPVAEPVPGLMAIQFEAVKDLGIREVYVKDRVFHRVRLWACYHLR